MEIPPQRFERVRGLLQEIRDARRDGVRPRICGCTVCSEVMRDEIGRATVSSKDLTLIWGIGRAFAARLEEVGIRTYDDLLLVDTSAIVRELRQKQYFVSTAQVDQWKHHATSYCTLRPVMFGDPPMLDGRFFALDLEYFPGGSNWLIGVCIAGPGEREYLSLWADTPEQEKRNLSELAAVVAAKPSVPVVTWCGTGADMPQLRRAAQRLELSEALELLELRIRSRQDHRSGPGQSQHPQQGFTLRSLSGGRSQAPGRTLRMALHSKTRQLARSGRVRTRRPNVPVPRSPHSRQTNPHRGNRRLGARPQCQPHQGRLAIHHQKCSHQT